jgi:hypothetical protein
MAHQRALIASLVALALAVGLAPATRAGGQKLKPVHQWSGSIDDLELQKLSPQSGYLADAKKFAELWKAWKVGEKMPEIDFKKQLVLVATTRGSRLNMTPRLDDKGDLRVLAIATRDLRPGFRYQIAVVDRAGVKTINGKELPAPGNH